MEVVLDRFLARVIVDDGCWLWGAGKNSAGYGMLNIRKPKYVLAHRYSYELLRGPIPTGLEMDHLCRVRACVRPSHLEPVTRQVNMLRGNTVAARNAAKTHCPKGHALLGDNLSGCHLRQGRRVCRTCLNERQRVHRPLAEVPV